jgi:hypothetical protein
MKILTLVVGAAVAGLVLAGGAQTAPGNGAAFGTRNTRDCGTNKDAPSSAELQQVFICEYEFYTPAGTSGAKINLVSNVAMQFSKGRPYNANTDAYSSIDVTQPVQAMAASQAMPRHKRWRWNMGWRQGVNLISQKRDLGHPASGWLHFGWRGVVDDAAAIGTDGAAHLDVPTAECVAKRDSLDPGAEVLPAVFCRLRRVAVGRAGRHEAGPTYVVPADVMPPM